MAKQFLLSVFLFVFSFLGFSQESVEELTQKLEKTSDQTTRLEWLDALTKKTSRENSERKVNFLKEYLSTAKELKEYDKLVKK